ncbi:MAG: Signal peptidase [Streptococcaceae bacterium]|jgi:cell fate regulator YaaT (PSP1 superfamily)|nr:Signal peptidase [Streptococcaceae bacterium]
MIYEVTFSNGFSNLLVKSDQEIPLETAVMVKTDKATLHLGKLLRCYDENSSHRKIEVGGQLIRLATAEDFEIKKEVLENSRIAKSDVIDIVKAAGLDMKVMTVNYSFDYSFLFISFVADNRVDFRQLLRDLAAFFQIRIELRQIGTRDAAQLVGGLGPCGRPLCCSEFLYEFPTVSIKMAKNQQIAFSQGKLNGACGRLMCCLSYEDDFYKAAAKEFPDYGDYMKSPEGLGRVIGMNIMNRMIKLKFADFVREYTLDELKEQEVVHDG